MSNKHARQADKHHSTLNAFHAVVVLMEGGMVYDEAAFKAASRIIAIAKAEQQRQLTKYDANIAKAADDGPKERAR